MGAAIRPQAIFGNVWRIRNKESFLPLFINIKQLFLLNEYTLFCVDLINTNHRGRPSASVLDMHTYGN